MLRQNCLSRNYYNFVYMTLSMLMAMRQYSYGVLLLPLVLLHIIFSDLGLIYDAHDMCPADFFPCRFTFGPQKGLFWWIIHTWTQKHNGKYFLCT
jgi:hypothetical protein